MRHHRVVACMVGVVLSWAGAGLCFGQGLQIEPDARRPNRVYTIRLVNETGRPVCVKIEGYGRSRSYHADFRPGQSHAQEFYGGLRVVIVWDDDTGNLLMADIVDINRDGKLRLRGMAPASAEKGVAPRAVQPQIEIEPN